MDSSLLFAKQDMAQTIMRHAGVALAWMHEVSPPLPYGRVRAHNHLDCSCPGMKTFANCHSPFMSVI